MVKLKKRLIAHKGVVTNEKFVKFIDQGDYYLNNKFEIIYVNKKVLKISYLQNIEICYAVYVLFIGSA